MRVSTGCELSENSRNSPVTTNAVCSPMSTALSPTRPIARLRVLAGLDGHLEDVAVQAVDLAVLAYEVLGQLDVALGEGPLALQHLGPRTAAHRQQCVEHPLVDRRLVARQRQDLRDR